MEDLLFWFKWLSKKKLAAVGNAYFDKTEILDLDKDIWNSQDSAKNCRNAENKLIYMWLYIADISRKTISFEGKEPN